MVNVEGLKQKKIRMWRKKMIRRTIHSDIYGKIVYKEDCWKIKEKLDLKINGKDQIVKGEIDVFSMIYEEKKLGWLDEKQIAFYEEAPYLVNEEKAKKIEEFQKEIFQKVMVFSKEEICRNIEEAALQKREERLQGQTIKNFSRIVGKEKAYNCFAAKTREEKLASIILKKMRVMQDSIEITCNCDWFKPSGGFVIYGDGSVEMKFIDTMRI